MKTESLIDMLSRSAHESKPQRSPWLPLGLLLAGAGGTLLLTLVLYKLNPDLLAIAASGWFWLRFGFLLSLGLLAWVCLSQLGNPGRAQSTRLWWLALPSVVMGLIALVMLFNAPPNERVTMLLGTTWKVCSMSIAFLAVPLFAAAVAIVRGFAPTRLKATGAVLGLFSGALAALIYTLHCPELHPAFLVWYGIGMLIPAALGWLLGEKLLRW
jgi:hypothetical protein